MIEAPAEFIIVCAYCDRCYGKYADGKKTYFTSPIKFEKDTLLEMSHGICPNCYKDIEEDGPMH
jgi:hypothetical protein